MPLLRKTQLQGRELEARANYRLQLTKPAIGKRIVAYAADDLVIEIASLARCRPRYPGPILDLGYPKISFKPSSTRASSSSEALAMRWAMRSTDSVRI